MERNKTYKYHITDTSALIGLKCMHEHNGRQMEITFPLCMFKQEQTGVIFYGMPVCHPPSRQVCLYWQYDTMRDVYTYVKRAEIGKPPIQFFYNHESYQHHKRLYGEKLYQRTIFNCYCPEAPDITITIIPLERW